MRKQLVLVLVLVFGLSTSVASAEKLASPKPRPVCKPNGAVWVQIEVTDARPQSTQWTSRLYANGATTMSEKLGTSVSTRTNRCLSASVMENIQKLLVGSPWKATKNRVKCEESSPRTTVVRVFGKKVFTDNGCSPDTLDEKSAEALEHVRVSLPKPITDECMNNPLAKGCV